MSRALLVVDLQNALVDELPPQRRAELLDAVTDLLQDARANGLPVVYIRHNEDDGPLRLGTPQWEIADEVSPKTGDPILEKRFGDAFRETDLSDVLAVRRINHVVICGMQSDFCVEATAGGASERGYRVTVVENAHATYPSDGKTEREIIDALHCRLQSKDIALSASATAFAT